MARRPFLKLRRLIEDEGYDLKDILAAIEGGIWRAMAQTLIQYMKFTSIGV